MNCQTISDITDNSRVIVDSNIFLYSALRHPNHHQSCYNLLKKVEEREIRGFVPSIVIQEVLHRLMIAELQKKSGEKDLQKIKHHIRKTLNHFKVFQHVGLQSNKYSRWGLLFLVRHLILFINQLNSVRNFPFLQKMH